MHPSEWVGMTSLTGDTITADDAARTLADEEADAGWRAAAEVEEVDTP